MQYKLTRLLRTPCAFSAECFLANSSIHFSLQSAQEARSKSWLIKLLFPLIIAEPSVQHCWAHTPTKSIMVVFAGWTLTSFQTSSSLLVGLSSQGRVCWPKVLGPRGLVGHGLLVLPVSVHLKNWCFVVHTFFLNSSVSGEFLKESWI